VYCYIGKTAFLIDCRIVFTPSKHIYALIRYFLKKVKKKSKKRERENLNNLQKKPFFCGEALKYFPNTFCNLAHPPEDVDSDEPNKSSVRPILTEQHTFLRLYCCKSRLCKDIFDLIPFYLQYLRSLAKSRFSVNIVYLCPFSLLPFFLCPVALKTRCFTDFRSIYFSHMCRHDE
jgi:hypothetical protein